MFIIQRRLVDLVIHIIHNALYNVYHGLHTRLNKVILCNKITRLFIFIKKKDYSVVYYVIVFAGNATFYPIV